MPNIFLQHPVHGAKIATSDLEVKYDMDNGWLIKTALSAADEPEDVEPVANALEQPKRRARRAREENVA
jgi:hypothetical protein